MVLYGITTWGDLFTQRQALALSTVARLIAAEIDKSRRE